MAVIVLPSVPFGRQEAGQVGPRYRLVLPSLAAQGESFTGMVVAETASGATPLGEGDQVSFNGTVVPVQKDGSVELPAFVKETGNVFVVAEILHATAPGQVNRYPAAEHVEIIPIRAIIPTKIAWTSTIVPGGGTIRVVGSRLKALTEAALERADGSRVALGASVGSSLERFYPLPVGEDLTGGVYRFIGLDGEGRRYEAPHLTHIPRITVSGTPILRRGQRGKITIAVQSGVPVTVELRGGLPQIELKEHVVEVPANGSRSVDFTARALGQYHLVARIVSPEDPVVATDATRVDATADPPDARYDPRRDITSVASRFRVIDKRGRPVRRTSVDIALSHPKGVEFTRVATDNRGMANVMSELTGRVAIAEVSAHLYRVLGWSWKEPPTGTPVLIAEKCNVSAKWHPGPPINITRELSYVPSDPQALSHMRPGDLIGLSVLAEDDDVLVQECACHGDVDIRQHPPTPDMVRYTWTLDGPGTLINPGGSTTNSVLYQVPLCLETAAQRQPARITVHITGDLKAEDEAIDRSVTLQPSITTVPGTLGTQLREVSMVVRPGAPGPSPAGEPLADRPGEMCVYDTPVWTAGDKLTGDPRGLGRAGAPDGWPDNLAVVRADYWDSDDLTIKCKSDHCGPASERMPQVFDAVRNAWSVRGGAELPLGSAGAAVIVHPFFRALNQPFDVQVRVTDSGRQGRDTPPVTRKITLPRRQKPRALVALGDISGLTVDQFGLEAAFKKAAEKYRSAGYDVDYVPRLTWAKMKEVVQDARYQAIFIIGHGDEGMVFLTDTLTTQFGKRNAMEPSDIEGWVNEKWQCPKHPFIRELILLACYGGKEAWSRPFFSLEHLVEAQGFAPANFFVNAPLDFVVDYFRPLPPRIPW